MECGDTSGFIGMYVTHLGAITLTIKDITASKTWQWSTANTVAGSNVGVFLKYNTAGTVQLWVNGASVAMPAIGSPPAYPAYPAHSNAQAPIYFGYEPDTGSYYPGSWAAVRISWNTNDNGVLYSTVGTAFTPTVQLTPVGGGTTYSAPAEEVLSDTKMTCVLPNAPAGSYNLNVVAPTTSNILATRSLPFTITQNMNMGSAFDTSFASPTEVRSLWMASNYAWGGANNGVVPANVSVVNGVVILEGHGSLYTGSVQGVDNNGNPVSGTTLVGASIVTKAYYGPGSWEWWAQGPPLVGASFVGYLFQYVEVYPTDARYAGLLAAGYTQDGSEAEGYYIAENNEIDVEQPHTLSGSGVPTEIGICGFNTWWGDIGNSYELHNLALGFNPSDGYHHYRLDWYTGDAGEEARVDFYLDGRLVQTNTTYLPKAPMRFRLDYWFPQGGTLWAGVPNWAIQQFKIKRVKYTPFTSQTSYQNIAETYPYSHYQDITNFTYT